MIDYSVYMMTNPMDEEAPSKAYGKAQMSELMTFDKFVKHIADTTGRFRAARCRAWCWTCASAWWRCS